MKLWQLLYRSTFPCPKCGGTLEYGPGATAKEYIPDAYLFFGQEIVWALVAAAIGGITYWLAGEIAGLVMASAFWLALTRYFSKFFCRKCSSVFTCGELLRTTQHVNNT